MGWNIGHTGETGLWVGSEDIIRDNLIFYLDPGDYNCVPDGGSSDSTCTELALGDTGNVTSPGNDIGDLWTIADGGPCFTFDSYYDHSINFPSVDVSEFVTGGSTTTGAITSCIWFRTSHMDGTADGGLVFIEGFTYGVFISDGDIQQFAADTPGAKHEYTILDVTAYNDDNWHFLVAMMNNTSSTIGDTPAGECAIYVDDMTIKAASSTFDSSFEFRTTDADLNIGLLDDNGWEYDGEMGPIMIYSDYCLDEDERIMNYNYHRHRYYDTAIG